MSSRALFAAGACLSSLPSMSADFLAPQLIGDVMAVYDMLDRVLPGSKDHFVLNVRGAAVDMPSYTVSDTCHATGPCKVTVSGSGANEVASGIGWYLRERCNMTVGTCKCSESR